MENKSYDIALLDKYLEGSLTPSEKEELERHFDNQEELESEAQIHQAIVEGIQMAGNREVVSGMIPEIEKTLTVNGFFKAAHQENQGKKGFRRMLDGIEDELDEKGYFEKVKEANTSPSNVVKLNPFSLKRIISVAAILLLIPTAIGIFKYLDRSSVNDAIVSTLKSEQVEANIFAESINEKQHGAAGVIAAQAKILKTGLFAFHEGDFKKAEKNIGEFHKNYPKEETAAYYLALCYLKKGKYKEAELLLSKDIYKEQKSNVLWLKALCLYKKGEKEQSLKLLESVASGDSNQAPKAKELLVQLKNKAK